MYILTGKSGVDLSCDLYIPWTQFWDCLIPSLTSTVFQLTLTCFCPSGSLLVGSGRQMELWHTNIGGLSS